MLRPVIPPLAGSIVVLRWCPLVFVFGFVFIFGIGMDQIDFKDDLVINDLGVDRLPEHYASLADLFREALFQKLPLFLGVVDEGPPPREGTTRKEGLDVDIVVAVGAVANIVAVAIVGGAVAAALDKSNFLLVQFLVTEVLLVQEILVQECLKLCLGLLALPMSLGKLRHGGFCPLQDLQQVGPRKNVVAIAFAFISSIAAGAKRRGRRRSVADPTAVVHIQRGQLGGNGSTRPGISRGIGDLVVRQRKACPIARTVFFFLGQINTEDRLAEALQSRFVVDRVGGSLGNHPVLVVVAWVIRLVGRGAVSGQNHTPKVKPGSRLQRGPVGIAGTTAARRFCGTTFSSLGFGGRMIRCFLLLALLGLLFEVLVGIAIAIASAAAVSPQLVQEHQVLVDGTTGLDDGGIFQDRPEDLGACIAVRWVIQGARPSSDSRCRAATTAAPPLDQMDHQAGGGRRELDHCRVAKGRPVSGIRMLGPAFREALNVEAEKAAVVGDVAAEPLVDRLGIVRVRDTDWRFRCFDIVVVIFGGMMLGISWWKRQQQVLGLSVWIGCW